MRREQRVLKHDVIHMNIGTGDLEYAYNECPATEFNIQDTDVLRPAKFVEHSIRWSDNRRLPALFGKGGRQVTDDVPNATDFAGRESAILGGYEYDLLVVDENRP